jgi:hypothetical protein
MYAILLIETGKTTVWENNLCYCAMIRTLRLTGISYQLRDLMINNLHI